MNDVVVFFGLDRAFIKETKEVKRNEKQKKNLPHGFSKHIMKRFTVGIFIKPLISE